MKLSSRHLRTTRMELSMTSMIDVVFLLLIFFIVTSTFVRPERQIHSAITVNQKNASAEMSNLDPAIIDIALQDSQIIYSIGAIRTNDLDKVKSLLNAFENKSEGAFVRVSGDVPYEAAAKTIGTCRASGFSTVSYLGLK